MAKDFLDFNWAREDILWRKGDGRLIPILKRNSFFTAKLKSKVDFNPESFFNSLLQKK